jgi:hypothetical protein
VHQQQLGIGLACYRIEDGHSIDEDVVRRDWGHYFYLLDAGMPVGVGLHVDDGLNQRLDLNDEVFDYLVEGSYLLMAVYLDHASHFLKPTCFKF